MTAFRPHPMQPVPEHDEQARMEFVQSFRRHMSARVMPGNRRVYEQRVEPAFRAAHGRAPADYREIRTVMERDPYYQFWSALQRRSQEIMWEAVADPIERELPQLIRRARASAITATSATNASNASRSGKTRRPARAVVSRRGSLTLDPKLVVPRYHTACDIHLQPGGYHSEFAADDIAAGALYDRALHLYSNGATGPDNESMGELLLGCWYDHYPEHRPRRMLDIGCSIGNSALPWARALPRCEVHAIDVAAPQLRYAHARAQELGVPVHFSQQNAEHTQFASASFDLIVSHLVLHETSRSALPAILRECHRLLRPGGVMLHLEIPRGNTPLEKFFYNWETWNNNETFSAHLTDLDLTTVAIDCGFKPESTHNIAVLPKRSADQKLYADSVVWKVLAAVR